MAAMRAPKYPRIVQDSRILGGVPIIRGTRVPVRAIAFIWRSGHDRAHIHRDYPTLDTRDIDDAIKYYESHRAEIDADLLDEQHVVD